MSTRIMARIMTRITTRIMRTTIIGPGRMSTRIVGPGRMGDCPEKPRTIETEGIGMFFHRARKRSNVNVFQCTHVRWFLLLSVRVAATECLYLL